MKILYYELFTFLNFGNISAGLQVLLYKESIFTGIICKKLQFSAKM